MIRNNHIACITQMVFVESVTHKYLELNLFKVVKCNGKLAVVSHEGLKTYEDSMDSVISI